MNFPTTLLSAALILPLLVGCQSSNQAGSGSGGSADAFSFLGQTFSTPGAPQAPAETIPAPGEVAPTPAAGAKTEATVVSASGATVCDPFGGGAIVSQDNGLDGRLYYLAPELPRYTKVADYIQAGTPVDSRLILNKIDVPTRRFEDGFVTQEGKVLATPKGETLYEWFALRLNSSIRLALKDKPGNYQFALLSDDGSVMRVKQDGVWSTLIDNDGFRSSALKVADRPIYFDGNTELPIEIDYFQGPRTHIAIMLLWREWPENGSGAEPLNGRAGNDLYFNSNVKPSAPQQAWFDLISRGWNVVGAENFFLPATSKPNDCVPTLPTNPVVPVVNNDPDSPAALAITGFDASSSASEMVVIWQTNQAATTKVYYGTTAEKLEQMAEMPGDAANVHLITVKDLTPNTAYYLRAESVDASGQKVLSNVIRKTTK